MGQDREGQWVGGQHTLERNRQHTLEEGRGRLGKALGQASRADLDPQPGRSLGQLVEGRVRIGQIGKDQGLHEGGAIQLGLALDKVGLTGQALGDGGEDILHSGSNLLYDSHWKAPVAVWLHVSDMMPQELSYLA